ncbi:hypothetical protein [Marinobacter sp. W-8]|uniref:hypothetical protein n=1 Tax=Marinobacter sp. W-8 TaxID=3369658 RepID=UPI0037C59F6B
MDVSPRKIILFLIEATTLGLLLWITKVAAGGLIPYLILIFTIGFGHGIVIKHQRLLLTFMADIAAVGLLAIGVLLPIAIDASFHILVSEFLATELFNFSLTLIGIALLMITGSYTGSAIRERIDIAREDPVALVRSYHLDDEDLDQHINVDDDVPPRPASPARRPKIKQEHDKTIPASAEEMEPPTNHERHKPTKDDEWLVARHRTRIELIRGYVHALQPVLVFIAAIFGAYLTYLGNKG